MPAPRVIGVDEARTRLGRLVEQVAGDGRPVFLRRRGRSRAVIVAIGDYARLRRALESIARDRLGQELMNARRVMLNLGLPPDSTEEIMGDGAGASARGDGRGGKEGPFGRFLEPCG